MIVRGMLTAESPIYRGNARKTLFTRDGDGKQRLVSLAGEIAGTAQSLMDAFIGRSHNGRNIGLLDRLWLRLYGSSMPNQLITNVSCNLQKESYLSDRFFDLRMGIKLDEDRWAAEANANYKMETLLRHSVFDFSMNINESLLQQSDNAAKLYYCLEELKAGRFWFGAGKSKGLGRCRLQLEWPFATPQTVPNLAGKANHLSITLSFDAMNPILVGWNWGKIDPDEPSFKAVEGQVLVEALQNLPKPIRKHLEMVLSGPILNVEDWKKKFANFLPRTIAVWLRKHSEGEIVTWTLSPQAMSALSKGKYSLTKDAQMVLRPLVGKPFAGKEVAITAIEDALANHPNMVKRVLKSMTAQKEAGHNLNQKAWDKMAAYLGLDETIVDALAVHIANEGAVVSLLTKACQPILPQLFLQIDQQIKLLQSDSWIDQEIENRTQHFEIKKMLYQGQIHEGQWNNRREAPAGIELAAWQEFLDSHQKVRFSHLLNSRNLAKSMLNDKNAIGLLTNYRTRTRQELSQPQHLDFRSSSPSNRHISRKYGKPYDIIFMRMLSWAPSSTQDGAWEVYIPGSTIKGAFRKRASQVLKTVWGSSRQTDNILDRLFGKQAQIGLILFSDAYLMDPNQPERAWCSMDGVKMDPNTGVPIDSAKSDYLYAYGDHLIFKISLDLQDINEYDDDALSVLAHLIEDFQQGDIPLGGEKTSGLGWVEAQVDSIKWFTSDPEQNVSDLLFDEYDLIPNGIWHQVELNSDQSLDLLDNIAPLLEADKSSGGASKPPKTYDGYISHRSFGGHCGRLEVEAEILTPIMVKESGEPSFGGQLSDGPIHGWDFFSMSPAEAGQRDNNRLYALPSKTIRGVLRHLYTIASDSREESPDISRLNPVDSLFGWVGRGPNQAIAGRVVVNFAHFEEPELGWFKIPFPYGDWHFVDGVWRQVPNGSAQKLRIDRKWRLFAHTPLAPIIKKLDNFQPNTAQAYYARAIMPGARARFTVRFWNLEDEELQRLIWCIALEPGLAHKIGKNRYLGFGSLSFKLLPESYLIDWNKRYAGEAEEDWQLPIEPKSWFNQRAISHYKELRRALNAKQL